MRAVDIQTRFVGNFHKSVDNSYTKTLSCVLSREHRHRKGVALSLNFRPASLAMFVGSLLLVYCSHQCLAFARAGILEAVIGF